MKNAKMVLMWSGIVVELAGIVLIVKSMASDSSPAIGIVLLSVGVITMVIGVVQKTKQGEQEAR